MPEYRVRVGKLQYSISQSLGHKQGVYLSGESPLSGRTVCAPKQKTPLFNKVIPVGFGPLHDFHRLRQAGSF